MIKPMNSVGMSLLPHFLSTQLSSSDASNFRWDTIGMNQASCESTWWCWQKQCAERREETNNDDDDGDGGNEFAEYFP